VGEEEGGVPRSLVCLALGNIGVEPAARKALLEHPTVPLRVRERVEGTDFKQDLTAQVSKVEGTLNLRVP